MTQESIIGFLGSGVVGAVVKHFVPSDRVNKFIPLINVVACAGYLFAKGVSPLDAVVNGAIIALAAGKTHDVATEATPLKNISVAKWWNTSERQGL